MGGWFGVVEEWRKVTWVGERVSRRIARRISEQLVDKFRKFVPFIAPIEA